MLLDEPLERRCFFCDPEPWRTLFRGKHVLLLAGAGPLCPGYIMLAPLKHVATVAELDEPSFWEFLALFEVSKELLLRRYGDGYTAYEHGRVGSCRIEDARPDTVSFCHHAHRIVIPRLTACRLRLEASFDKVRALSSPQELRELAGTPYVYYETGGQRRSTERWTFLGERGIPSQFMRRILTEELKLGRNWNWAADLNHEEMVDTACRLHNDLVAMASSGPAQNTDGGLLMPGNLSIDGLTEVGKTTLAMALGGHFGRQVIDTGLIFRALAHANVHGLERPSTGSLLSIVKGDYDPLDLRNPTVSAKASELAADMKERQAFNALVADVITTLQPCIVIGRDAWRFMHPGDASMVVEANVETRVRRRLFWRVSNEHHIVDPNEIRMALRHSDAADSPRLPPLTDGRILRMTNDHHTVDDLLRDALSLLSPWLRNEH